ncbi:MAG: clostripain-related cysteine peptidase [Candidatus Microthrix parvicella]
MRRAAAVGLVFVMLAGACSRTDDASISGESSARGEDAAAEDGSWTILQYSMADNNLEEFMMVDLEELAEVESDDGPNIVALVDRSEEESEVALGDQGDWAGARILRLGNGEFSTLSELGDVNTGDPALLADFISESIKENPADHYGLVISDHGASWPGIGPDDSFDDSLELAELQTALGDGLEAAGVERLDVLGFDACLMASYEVASAMAPFADRMIASEQLEPGHGWDYRSFQVLADEVDADTFGRAVIEGFAEQAVESDTEQDITLSLLDLTKMGALDQAIEDFAGALTERGANVAPVVGRERASTLEFGRSPDETEASHVVDLRMLASQIGVESLDLSEFTDEVEKSLNDVVVQSIDSPANLGASGMTIYFPPAVDYYDAGYEDAPSTGPWSAFLDGYYGSGAEIPDTDQARFVDAEPEVFFDDDGVNIQAEIESATTPNVADSFIRYGVVGDDGTVTYLGEEPATSFDDGTAQGTYDLTELVISDGEDEARAYVDLQFEEDDEVGTIDVPIAYYGPDDEAGGSDYQDALLSITFDTESGDVLQETYYAYHENTGGYGELQTSPEGIVVPEVLVLDDDGGETWEPTSGVGLFADLPSLSYELRPLASGTLLQIELGVTDFGDNADIVSAEVELP